MSKDLVINGEVLDMVSIDNIETLEQADIILESCNDSDSEVLEVYVQNAITRGAVYHKLTMVGDGELGLLRDEVANRYNISGGSVSNYTNIFHNKDIILRKFSALGQCDDANLRPTLTSLLDTIKKDPDSVTKMIAFRVTNRGVSEETQKIIIRGMDDESEDIRYLFSKTNKVSLGALATAFKTNNKKLVYELIDRNGKTDNEYKENKTKNDLKSDINKLENEITELRDENEMLKRRNKFLVDSFRLSDVRSFLNRALKNKGILKRYKPELEDAFNLLGVDVSIDEKKLKKAYKEKVGIYHSDITGDEDMFRRVIEANKLVLEYIKGL